MKFLGLLACLATKEGIGLILTHTIITFPELVQREGLAHLVIQAGLVQLDKWASPLNVTQPNFIQLGTPGDIGLRGPKGQPGRNGEPGPAGIPGNDAGCGGCYQNLVFFSNVFRTLSRAQNRIRLLKRCMWEEKCNLDGKKLTN